MSNGRKTSRTRLDSLLKPSETSSLSTCGFLCACVFSSRFGTRNDVLESPPISLKTVLSAYNDGRPFSLDLVGAVSSNLWVPIIFHEVLTGWFHRSFVKTHLLRRCTNSVGANQDFLTIRRMKLCCIIVLQGTMRTSEQEKAMCYVIHYVLK